MYVYIYIYTYYIYIYIYVCIHIGNLTVRSWAISDNEVQPRNFWPVNNGYNRGHNDNPVESGGTSLSDKARWAALTIFASCAFWPTIELHFSGML